MKKGKTEELRAEYCREELGLGVRGKYFDIYKKGSNLVLLSPDVAKAFPTEEAVNDALRSLINIATRSIRATKRSSRHLKTRGSQQLTSKVKNS